MKTLKEVLVEIESGVSITPKGKKKKTFSRSDFDKVSTALVNEVDYSVPVISIRGGNRVTDTSLPVKDFRNNIKKVLLDYGVDKQEAESFVTDYKFGKFDGLYGICSAAIKEYCGAGKKFDFPTEEEFKASITIEDVPTTTKEYKSISRPGDNSPKESFKIETKAHKELKSSSKAPSWLKKKK